MNKVELVNDLRSQFKTLYATTKDELIKFMLENNCREIDLTLDLEGRSSKDEDYDYDFVVDSLCTCTCCDLDTNFVGKIAKIEISEDNNDIIFTSTDIDEVEEYNNKHTYCSIEDLFDLFKVVIIRLEHRNN